VDPVGHLHFSVRITLAGWSSNNKYAMLGGLRATAQMISYELALGLAYVGPILLAGSMSLGAIVAAQRILPNFYFAAGGVWHLPDGQPGGDQPAPFDMPEAEQELTAGYHTEYSSMKFALFFMAEYIKMVAVSMIGATLFFGGYLGPFVDQYPILGPIYLFIKTAIWMFLIIWLRATLAPHPLRPADGPGLEGYVPAGPGQRGGHGHRDCTGRRLAL